MATSRTDQKPIVFLSHPVTDYLSEDGTFRPEKRRFVESVIEVLQDLGLTVECAGLNEDFGRIKLQPVEFTTYDVEAIERSRLFVLIASERLTRDMYLEAGIAFGLRLPVFFFVPASARVTYMIMGLEEMGRAKTVKYDSEANLPNLVRTTLRDKVSQL